MIKDGTTRAKPSIWSQRTTRSWAVWSALLEPMRSGCGRQVTAPRWGFTWASFSAGSLWSAGGQRLDFSTVFFPWPFFWSGFSFCFLPNRKFLTRELLLGLGNWGALLWILRGTVVAATSVFALLLPASTSSGQPSSWTLALGSVASSIYSFLCGIFCLYFVFFFF